MNKFIIDDIKIIGGWKYILPSNTECSICRASLNSNSLLNNDDTESNIVTGLCSHTFHEECIKPWLKNNKHCPLCSKDYIINKNI